MKNFNLTRIGVLFLMLAMSSKPVFANSATNQSFEEITTPKSAEISVRGIVVDNADGSAMVGASIIVKGTNRGTITDADGKFDIQHVNGGDTLVFTYMGFLPVEYVIPSDAAGQLNITIRMDVNLEIF